jgi:hypothetical protein
LLQVPVCDFPLHHGTKLLLRYISHHEKGNHQLDEVSQDMSPSLFGTPIFLKGIMREVNIASIAYDCDDYHLEIFHQVDQLFCMSRNQAFFPVSSSYVWPGELIGEGLWTRLSVCW